jgi:hypothetical protein
MTKSYRRRNRIGGQFAPRLIEMLRSPAYRILSRAALQVLARIEIELADHGGMDNGKLPVTYTQFTDYGLHHNAIAPAIRELVELGFVEITEQGRAGNAEFRSPSKYRITYRDADRAPPTHEWRRISEDDADMIAKGARRHGSNSRRSRNINNADDPTREKQKTTPEKRTTPTPEKRTENPVFHSTDSGCTGHSTETGCTIDTLGVVVGDAAGDLKSETAAAAAPAQPGSAVPSASNGQPHADPWADLDIPEFLWRCV